MSRERSVERGSVKRDECGEGRARVGEGEGRIERNV